VSGTHYYRNLPKSNVWVILILLLSLFSLLMHVLQTQRHEYGVKALVKLAILNAGVKLGGSKESQEIYRRAAEMYDSRTRKLTKEEIAAATQSAIDGAKGNKLSALAAVDGEGKPLGSSKLQRDPIFLAAIDEVDDDDYLL
jgi:hypothetical protein